MSLWKQWMVSQVRSVVLGNWTCDMRSVSVILSNLWRQTSSRLQQWSLYGRLIPVIMAQLIILNQLDSVDSVLRWSSSTLSWRQSYVIFSPRPCPPGPTESWSSTGLSPLYQHLPASALSEPGDTKTCLTDTEHLWVSLCSSHSGTDSLFPCFKFLFELLHYSEYI